VRDAFTRYVVWRAYCDPQHIDMLGLQNEFGEKRVMAWETYRPRPIAWAVRNFEEAVNGPSRSSAIRATSDLGRHVRNSRKRMLTVLDDKERPMHTLSKPAAQSPHKIDGAMAAVLAWEARGTLSRRARCGWVMSRRRSLRPPTVWRPGHAPPAPVFSTVESGPMGALS
jgi:hypothetical protein